MKGKWFLGIVFVLGSTIAIGILVFLSIVREPAGMAAIPTPTPTPTLTLILIPAPTPCIKQEGAHITCTLSASTTRVKVGEIVTFTMAISNPIGSCSRIDFVAYDLTQSPLLFTSVYRGFIEYDLDEELVHTDLRRPPLETFDVKAVQAGQGVITGRVDFEINTINTPTWAWSSCDAGEVDILVEP